jgi:hypothetical protein
MTTQKAPELSAKLMMARMRRKMVMERWHMGFNKTKQQNWDSVTTIQSHIWDQEIITVSISICSQNEYYFQDHTSPSSLSTLNTTSACTAT